MEAFVGVYVYFMSIFTEKVPYFLEYTKSMDKEIKKYTSIKYESSINPHNLKEIKVSNEVLVHGG